jgi:hypothetical protein
MKRSLILVLVIALVVIACGDDETTAGTLTAAEREWCGFDAADDEAAMRFDQIFEAGLGLGLPMDALNAQAAALRTQYAEQGMSDDEAVRAVSDDLLREEAYISACQAAYATYGG